MNPPAVSVIACRAARPSAMHPTSAASELATLDPESRVWIESLRAKGPARDETIALLHSLLLRAARFEVGRRRASVPALDQAELDDLALQSADDALLAVLSKLDQFRGRSRFTTWAYKFALLEAGVKLRRRPWQEREIPVEPASWPAVLDPGPSLEVEVEQAALLSAVVTGIEQELTSHQREILLAVAVGGVPIDVLAERLGTTRGALYKTIHDARVKLRRRLAAEGHELDADEGTRR